MTVNTPQDQYILSLSGNTPLQKLYKSPPLLQENETITFDLHSRILLLATGDTTKRVAKLSPIDAHLLLPLLYFYPHCVSDSTFALGYTTDLFTYCSYVKGERPLREPLTSYPVVDGIDRLKKKVALFGIAIVRLRTTGYVLRRSLDPLAKEALQVNRLYS